MLLETLLPLGKVDPGLRAPEMLLDLHWMRQGFAEAELADGGSNRFIHALVLWGDADTIRRGLRALFAAGATHVCLQPVHADGDSAARDRMLAALADT